MIVRILAEGQYEVPDDVIDELNAHDDRLTAALDAVDRNAFEASLTALLETVRARGSPVADDYIGPSEIVLPGADSSFEEVRSLLTDEGLIPG